MFFKKLLLCTLVLISINVFAQKPSAPPPPTAADTAVITDKIKFVKIGAAIYPVEAFTKNVPVFMSAQGWDAVLQIINTREYGKLPASVIAEILQAISQQLPKKENQ
jgi:hypothetical protein